jgi:hypothetical protein
MRFDRCPKSWLRDEAGMVKRLFDDATRFLTHGVLPRAGGYEDQDPRFCDSVTITDDVLTSLRGTANG